MKRTLKCLNRLVCLVLSTSVFVIGCSSTTAPPSAPGQKMPWKKRETNLTQIHNWNLNGKIGVRTAKDSGSASVTWQQSQGSYNVSLMGPLGAGAMTLKGRPGAVTLTTSDGKHYSAASPEQLLAQHWGYQLPVSYLNYWIRGIPSPSSPASTHFDQYNRMSYLTQAGWNVQYLGYSKTSMGDLPNQMSITSPSMKVKIIVNSWQVS